MGRDSKIEWTHHTFNPWHGCVKVSQGCKNCYADAQDSRFGESHWGPNARRRMMGEAYWREPLKWEREAKEAGERRRVFCASMADVFEQLPFDHPDYAAMSRARCDLWRLVTETPNLDWLLLTKRPENCFNLTPATWEGGWPGNVWIGVSVEDQAAADERLPELLRCPAAVRFVSYEPALGPVDFARMACPNAPHASCCAQCCHDYDESRWGTVNALAGLHWIIVGGESGPGARPMHPDWARSARDQCAAHDVAFFFKQHGEYRATDCWDHILHKSAEQHYVGPQGQRQSLRMAVQHPQKYGAEAGFAPVTRVGKKAAGRLLDGVEWSQFPERRAAR